MDRNHPPNILLVVLDCVRAKSLRHWGSTAGSQTPELDRLAGRSIVFSKAVAPSNWTYPSHLAMLTGVPSAVLPTEGARVFPLTLAEWLRQNKGYDTALFTENELLVAGLGLERGFSVLRGPASVTSASLSFVAGGPLIQRYRRVVYGERAVSVLRRVPSAAILFAALENVRYQARKRSHCSGQVVKDFSDWLDSRRSDAPFFVLVNIADAHEPFRNPSEWSRSGLRESGYRLVFRNHALMVPQLQERIPWADLERGYLWEIGQADTKVGEFLHAVEGHGDIERTIVMVTADHGQCLGESGFVYHGDGVADACARVPLLIHLPGTKPTHCDRWVSLTEIPGWVSSWVEGQQPLEEASDENGLKGSAGNRVAYCDGRPACDTAPVLRGRFSNKPWNRRLVAAYQGESKYVADVETRTIWKWGLEHGDPDRDPPERLVGPESEVAWKTLMEPYVSQRPAMATPGRPPQDDSRIVAALKAWGYD